MGGKCGLGWEGRATVASEGIGKHDGASDDDLNLNVGVVSAPFPCWQGPLRARTALLGHSPARLVLAVLCYVAWICLQMINPVGVITNMGL